MRYLTGLQAVGLDAPPLGLPPQWSGDASDWGNASAFSQGKDSLREALLTRSRWPPASAWASTGGGRRGRRGA
jgi:hypothetical protein